VFYAGAEKASKHFSDLVTMEYNHIIIIQYNYDFFYPRVCFYRLFFHWNINLKSIGRLIYFLQGRISIKFIEFNDWVVYFLKICKS
jgi:hypothetical protein